MKLRRQLTGVLCNFLDGYVSRYSDYDGYWIFGLLIRETDCASLDLLNENPDPTLSPMIAAAWRLAHVRFSRTLAKSQIPSQVASRATLRIEKMEPPTMGAANGRLLSGYRVRLSAEVISDFQKTYVAEKVIFVAPHDATVEHRSIRRNTESRSFGIGIV